MIFILLISFLVLAAIAAIVAETMRRPSKKLEEREGKEESKSGKSLFGCDEGCSGTLCDDCLVQVAKKKIEYFDDEELDEFKDKASDSYTEEETDRFREVFYTMRPEEVESWLNSLQMRGINLPDNIKDEVFLVVREQHNK
jgi:hypothetical protein